MTSVKASDALVSCNNTGVCCVRVTNGRVTELIGGQAGRQVYGRCAGSPRSVAVSSMVARRDMTHTATVIISLPCS